ncbi:hypothetical protein C8R47DRAFT_633023 [Mycena vitilis]|nr:hypothetical protein C8R47DRAFT_633023 [Mycena vitilis]
MSDSVASHHARHPLTLPRDSFPPVQGRGQPLYGLGWRTSHKALYEALDTQKCFSSIRWEIVMPGWSEWRPRFAKISFQPTFKIDTQRLEAGEDALFCFVTFNHDPETMDALATPGELEAFVDAARGLLKIKPMREEITEEEHKKEVDESLMWYICSVL